MKNRDWNFPIIFLAATTGLFLSALNNQDTSKDNQNLGPHGGRIVSGGPHQLEVKEFNHRIDVYGGANETEIPQNMTLKLLGDPKAPIIEMKALPPTEKEGYHFQGHANLDPNQERQAGIAIQFNIGSENYSVNVPK